MIDNLVLTYVTSPGSSVGECSDDEAAQFVADGINYAHSQTQSAIPVLENMAGQGNVLGSSFKQLSCIIDKVKDKSRIGVCLDTCHLFAAGYDVRTPTSFDKVLKQFDAEVGMNYLKALHLNDSKSELGSKKDRHENLGKGHIGLDCFRFIMNDTRFDHIPLILETPIKNNDFSIWKEEIALLRSFEQSPEAISVSSD